jgi:hypothetical protein
MSEYQYNPAYEESLRTSSVWQNEAIELRQKLEQARSLLIDALVKGNHTEHCQADIFARHNKHCPPSHPVWKSAPKCSCWVGAAAEFLKEPREQPKGPGLPFWDPAEAQRESNVQYKRIGDLSASLEESVSSLETDAKNYGTQTQGHSNGAQAVVEAPSRLEATSEQARTSRREGPYHAGYCKPELGCTCFVHTMRINGRL